MEKECNTCKNEWAVTPYCKVDYCACLSNDMSFWEAKEETMEQILDKIPEKVLKDYEVDYGPAMITRQDMVDLSGYDPVEKPEHYNYGKIECKDWIELGLTDEEFRGYLRGNVLKYSFRYRHKGGMQDLEKARVYTRFLMEFEEKVAANG